jgi:hypothetical protein
MMNFRVIRWPTVVAAALFSVAAGGQTGCGPTPEKYRDLEFGDARFAVEEDCQRTFTQDEQLFLAGIAERLRSHCKLPRDRAGRALVEQFTKAATLTVHLENQQQALRPRWAPAFTEGESLVDGFECTGPEAALLARGIVLYLKRTSGVSRFVAGCVEFYASRYDKTQCTCIADAVRPVVPEVDLRFFDRELVKDSIHHSPRVAVTLMLSCGVSEY